MCCSLSNSSHMAPVRWIFMRPICEWVIIIGNCQLLSAVAFLEGEGHLPHLVTPPLANKNQPWSHENIGKFGLVPCLLVKALVTRYEMDPLYEILNTPLIVSPIIACQTGPTTPVHWPVHAQRGYHDTPNVGTRTRPTWVQVQAQAISGCTTHSRLINRLNRWLGIAWFIRVEKYRSTNLKTHGINTVLDLFCFRAHRCTHTIARSLVHRYDAALRSIKVRSHIRCAVNACCF